MRKALSLALLVSALATLPSAPSVAAEKAGIIEKSTYALCGLKKLETSVLSHSKLDGHQLVINAAAKCDKDLDALVNAVSPKGASKSEKKKLRATLRQDLESFLGAVLVRSALGPPST